MPEIIAKQKCPECNGWGFVNKRVGGFGGISYDPPVMEFCPTCVVPTDHSHMRSRYVRGSTRLTEGRLKMPGDRSREIRLHRAANRPPKVKAKAKVGG